MKLTARSFTYQFPRSTLIMGILNVTPDSFSDGGQFMDPETAIKHASQMIQEGADWIDVGGESTRPGALEISEKEEAKRVFPVIEALSQNFPETVISIDTRKPGIAEGATLRGASVINDVEANRQDPAMWRVVAESGAAYVIMHMLGNPQTMQSDPKYSSRGVIQDILDFFQSRIRILLEKGAHADQLIMDFGIGFGKSLEHNLELLANMNAFHQLNRPLLIGASRKSFIGQAVNAPLDQRVPGSLAAAAWSVFCGAQILRVHDVTETTQVVRLLEIIRSKNKP